ncbi:RagB/SusD family nutrient uptake outer membrane protein [uncultured Bacteroides sp.]|uniref:RagB/SusD family nutrient uptake outer membrane protein n=1 Tax=uncultured Bacteroides sp. TaxID=162156 RepID=UPI002AA738C5|nr:RagB/SusD family nutrient uptake outer membrane protein [uncultured Bacteroides sp.]
MKKIIILSIVSVMACLVGCDDFLETNPRTQVSEEEFYKTENEVMMGEYAVINDIQERLMEVFSYASLMSDESETGGGLGEGVYKTKYDTFTFDPSTSPAWWNEWDYGLYNGVTSCNILLSKLSSSTLDEKFVNSITAETRFYRALFYAYLFMGYEQFPLIEEPLKVSEIYTVKKGTREEIYDFMLSDLSDEIINNLPDKADTQEGRVSKDAARVLKTKLILFDRDESRYAEALADMKEIINSGRYSLMPNYLDIWKKSGEFCSESIYELEFAGDNTGEGSRLVQSLSGRDINDPRSASEGGLSAGYGQNTMPSTIYNMFASGDTRREGTVIDYREEAKKVQKLVADGVLAKGDTFIISDQQENFEWLGHYKYHARKESTSDLDPLDNYAVNFRFYRYADVLLLATELQARSTGSVDSEGQGWFDQIRDRAFQNTNHRIDLTTKSKAEILDILFKERGYEFMDEMQRWFDIMRFDKGTEILGSKGWTEKFRYFPIAQKEIDASNGALDQNPGWK